MARASRQPPIRSELMALLTTARMSPLDDTARLIVADWLEENGDESDRDRATFIRLQCEHARKDAVGRRRRDLTLSETQLLEKHQKTWLGGLTAMQSSDPRFTRGLVDLFVEAPNLCKRGMNSVLSSEAAGWIDELHLSKISLPLLERFLALPFVGLLGGLLMGHEGLQAPACQAIANCERLVRLHTLDLNYNAIGNEGAVALSQSPYLGNLSHLDLWICGIEVEGARALASMRCQPRPYWINLGGNSIGEEGIRALAGSTLLEKVRRFLIWGNAIRDSGVTHLVRGPHLQEIEELYLNENHLGMKAARVLASWEPLQNIRTLSIWGNLLRPRGGAILGSAPMPQMRMLLLSGTRIGDEGARALANNPTLRNLHSLDVGNTRLTDEGVRALLESPFLTELKNLNVSGNTISPPLLTECESRYEMTVRDEVP